MFPHSGRGSFSHFACLHSYWPSWADWRLKAGSEVRLGNHIYPNCIHSIFKVSPAGH